MSELRDEYSDSRYYADAILSCLTLLYVPARHISSITEEVTRLRAELRRHVTIDFVPPTEDLAAYEVEVQGDEQPLLFPALTPRKDRLVTLDQICAEDGNPLARLSHPEHVYLSKLMLSERLWITALPWLEVDYDVARANTEQVQLQLHAIIEAQPREARSILNEVFDHGVLRLFPSRRRPPDEARLYRLASLLAERYLVLIEFPGILGSRHRLSYVYRHPFSAMLRHRRDRFKEFLGGMVENSRFPVPLARRTDDYHFRMSAPEGHYYYRQAAFFATGSALGKGGKPSALPPFASRAPGQPCSAREEGALSEAHIYIANGSRSPNRLDVGVTTHELPLGSAGGAWLATAITFSLTVLLLALYLVTDDAVSPPNSDVPALMVALVASSVGVSGAMFYGSESRSMAALSKLAYLSCALLGNAFAVWWVLTGTTIEREESLPGTVARFAQDYLGLFAVLGLGLLFASMSWRVVRVIRSFKEVLKVSD